MKSSRFDERDADSSCCTEQLPAVVPLATGGAQGRDPRSARGSDASASGSRHLARQGAPGPTSERLFVWANENGVEGMRPPECYEARGYTRVRRHPFWPTSWLMEKALGTE